MHASRAARKDNAKRLEAKQARCGTKRHPCQGVPNARRDAITAGYPDPPQYAARVAVGGDQRIAQPLCYMGWRERVGRGLESL